MFGPTIPKELREKRQREKDKGSEVDVVDPTNEDSDLDDFIGPILAREEKKTTVSQTTTTNSGSQSQPSLLELHQRGLQNKPTVFGSEKALNEEVKQELLKKLSNVKGKFAPGAN